MNTRKLISLAALSLTLVAAAQVQVVAAPTEPATQVAPSAHWGVGVARGLDIQSRTITITHQAIATMGMSAMTMPFRMDEGVSVSSVKPGETVAFVLTSTAQGMVISSLRPVVVASAGNKPAANAMPGMPHKSGMNMMDECREMMTHK